MKGTGRALFVAILPLIAFVSPLDLVEVGLVSAEEAERLHAIETSGTAK